MAQTALRIERAALGVAAEAEGAPTRPPGAPSLSPATMSRGWSAGSSTWRWRRSRRTSCARSSVGSISLSGVTLRRCFRTRLSRWALEQWC